MICGCGQKYSVDVYPSNGRMRRPSNARSAAWTALPPPRKSWPARSAPNPGPQPCRFNPPPSAAGKAGGKLTSAKNELAPRLAQALKETRAQELAVHRKELFQAQQIAIAELVQLTHRLDELKVPMQERPRSYERRIQELEMEWAARSGETRELLKLKIERVRHQLEIEASTTGWNSTDPRPRPFRPGPFSPASATPVRSIAAPRHIATAG